METVIILGAGASGMVAALTAAESKNRRVLLLERQQRVGRKLLATGNGRCNLTNTGASPARYHGAEADFVRPALAAFPPEATLEFFRELGLVTVTEPGGRVYPLSDSANSVVDVLRFALDAAGVELRSSCPARALRREKSGGFSVVTDAETLRADRLIVACGGAAGAKLGGVGDGYDPSEKYDVMILVHGTGGTETYWLLDAQQIIPEPGFGVTTRELLDKAMNSGWCRKMIVATPCFYRDGSNRDDFERKRDEEQFLLELQNDILPALVNTYSTYASGPSREEISAARNHFAYAGLSLGSIYVYTSVMRECLDLFAWFGCFSGSEAREYMNALIAALNSEEYAHYPILYFYNSAGGSDSMFAEHRDDYRKLVAAVPALTDGKNAAFTEIRAASHSYKAWGTGLYNFLRVVFAQPEEPN